MLLLFMGLLCFASALFDPSWTWPGVILLVIAGCGSSILGLGLVRPR